MNTVIVGLTLLVTILAALALGVMVGYWLITGLLRAMGRHSQPAARPAVAMAAGDAHGGD